MRAMPIFNDARVWVRVESCEPFGVRHEEIGQHFDRDVAIQLRVAGAIHDTHTPGPKGGEDLIRAKPGAGGEGQRLPVDYTGRAAAPTELLVTTSETTCGVR